MSATPDILDKSMNRQQRRAFASRMRTTKDPNEALMAARQRGWTPEGMKAITFARPKVAKPRGKCWPKQKRELAFAFGKSTTKKRMRRHLRRAGWRIG